MAPPLKRTNRTSQPQIRCNMHSLAEIARHKRDARRWGFHDLSSFMRALLDAAGKGDPDTGVITVDQRFRPVGE